MYKHTRLFVQVYIPFLRFEIQARHDKYCAANGEYYNKVSREEKRKKFSDNLVETFLVLQ